MNSAAPPAARPPGVGKSVAKYCILAAIQVAVLRLISGRSDWLQAWLYVAFFFVSQLVTGLVLHRFAPDMMEERTHVRRDAKAWDKPIVATIMLLTLMVSCVAAWDVRVHWPPRVPIGWSLAGFGVCALGFFLTFRAMRANRFFSALVRIQSDRGHTVCDSGPYARVRHPGYTGALLFTLATPVALGSWIALVPAILAVAVLTFRTALEDRTLQAELAGYREYVGRVRYRLVPGLW